MQDMSDDDRKAILGETLMDELKAIREGIAALPTRQEFHRLEEKVDGLSDDNGAIKAALKDQGKQVTSHESRLITLEHAA